MNQDILASQPLLTIAIPTYERNDKIRMTLSALLPQVQPNCEVLIVDNASSTPVVQTIGDLLAQYPAAIVKIVRNPVNIGANANICRCFELAGGKYTWTMGDDDSPHPNAIATVLNTIASHPEVTYINFSTEVCRRRQAIEGSGRDSLIRQMDSFTNFVFMSTCVFETAFVNQELRFSYHFCYTMAPHLVPLFMHKEPFDFLLSDQQIVSPAFSPPDAEYWPRIHQVLGMMAILELPLGSESRKMLASKLKSSTSVSLLILCIQLLLPSLEANDKETALYYFDQMMYRLNYFESALSINRCTTVLYRFLLRAPKLSFKLLHFSAKHIGRPDPRWLHSPINFNRL